MMQATCPVCLKHEFHCNGCGADLTEHIDSLVDKPIKPKDEKMEETMIQAEARLCRDLYNVRVTLDEAERLGEEAKRIKAEIAKREEIGPGGWAMSNDDKKIVRITKVDGDMCWFKSGYGEVWLNRRSLTKLHPTPEVKAWLDSVIK